MAKDTFYFPHDYNARNDVKCLFLRQKLGMEGYGIFWFLVESLADAGGSLPMKIIPVLAMQMQVTDVKVSEVINTFELFEISDNHFFSARLNTHLFLRKTLSEKGKEGAASRWKNGEANGEANGGAIALHNGEAYAKESKGKESKGKESKERENAREENFLAGSNLFRKPNCPTWEQVHQYFSGAGGTEEMAKKFFEKWEAVEWYSGGSPIKNFAPIANSFIQNWKSNDAKFNSNGRSRKQSDGLTADAAAEWINLGRKAN